MVPMLLVIYSGFAHAFEADHLLAVSSIVTNRKKATSAIKDGLFWGLGHCSTIIIIGLLMIFFKVQIEENIFSLLEAGVGLLLIVLALVRLEKTFKIKEQFSLNSDQHSHEHQHSLAYFVGLVHGLAGSGALVVLVMAQITDVAQGLLYLGIFGFGSMLGMFVASGLMSIPFTQKAISSKNLQTTITLLSSLLCIFFGVQIIHNNLF